jgi:flagellar protein FlaG
MSSINAVNSAAQVNFAQLADNAAKVAVVEPVAIKPETATEAAKPVSQVDLQQAVDVINQAVALEQRSLNFSIDDVSGRSVIKVIDYETDELIKQIPSEELLKVAQDIKRLQNEMGQSIGLLIDNKV